MKHQGIGFRMAASRLTISVDERTRLAEKRVGQLVHDKWRLERLIGVGGTAAVFEARHPSGHRVAIKILHSDLARHAHVRERFLAEAYAANRVAHAGVVAVRDEGTTADGAVFLVMELLHGWTLAERLEAGTEPFSVGEVLDLGSQLLGVLIQAHARGVVHRDIKPENVFLTRDGRVKLLDFGLAQLGPKEGRAVETGTTLGTPAFMSPEQALGGGEELDGRSDLWSLAATLYLVLAGKPVRERGSAAELLVGAMTRPVTSLGRVVALPRSVAAIVDRALAFDRDDRFPDASSMQLALRAASQELLAQDSRATLPPRSLEPVVLTEPEPRLLPPPRGELESRPSVRPVVASRLPRVPAPAPQGSSALPFYVSFGFAVGLSLVIAARLSAGHAPSAAARTDAVTLAAAPSAPSLEPLPSPADAAERRASAPSARPGPSSKPEPVRPKRPGAGSASN